MDNLRKLDGKVVVIIDGRLDSGGSILRATCTLRNFGILSEKFHPIFDYESKEAKDLFSGKKEFDEFGTKLYHPLEVKPLFNLDTLLEVALEDEYITNNEKEDVLLWRDDYNKWKVIHSPVSRYS